MLTRKHKKTFLPSSFLEDVEFLEDKPKNLSLIDKSLKKFKRSNPLAKRITFVEGSLT